MLNQRSQWGGSDARIVRDVLLAVFEDGALSSHCEDTDQSLVVDLLSDEFVFTQRVACLSCDGIYWAFLHLLLHRTVEHEERLPCTLLYRYIHNGVVTIPEHFDMEKTQKQHS